MTGALRRPVPRTHRASHGYTGTPAAIPARRSLPAPAGLKLTLSKTQYGWTLAWSDGRGASIPYPSWREAHAALLFAVSHPELIIPRPGGCRP